ncbi:MAG TPA: TRAP transporter large permease [Dongiaceae bacterium]|nr:TRAP transporter large permease [Dongiaceae bacterium]
MSGTWIALLGFGGMLVLIALRLHVGVAMFVAGCLGYMYLSSGSALFAFLKTNAYNLFANYTLSVIPLFILMGALAEQSGLSSALFRAAAAFMGQVRGGLAMAVIAACTAFGAICGSSVATTATFGRAALPELLRNKYDGGFATGTIAVGGTLGILIPPSVILVIYAIMVEQNISHLFMAAFVPGLLASLFYLVTIFLVARRKPEMAPRHEPMARGERWKHAKAVWPVLLIATLVVGGIYGGVFSPTEGAAVGTVALLLIGLAQRSLGWAALRTSILNTASTTAMIFVILMGSEIFNAFLALSQMPMQAAALITALGLPPYGVLAAILALYILLGAVMDELAMILLTLPVFFPIVSALDFGMQPDDLAIWFGILLLMVVGIGLTAPPIGLNVFVISAIAKNVPLARTYRGVLPFIAADVVRLVLVLLFPGLALGLVHLLA